MGLAASQARFLAITSRKMNCEFQSMQIAQQKLSVTRDLQKAAQDYQTNLAATKLVWEDMDSNTYDVTYDMMMTPSAINQYDPYLITDTQGKIVLNETMYNAAVNAGIIDKNTGEPKRTGLFSEGESNARSDGSRNAFLNQLCRAGNVDTSVVNSIISLDGGYTQSGIGGPVADKSIANALTSNLFKQYLGATYKEAGIDVDDSLKDTKIYGINFLEILEQSVDNEFNKDEFETTNEYENYTASETPAQGTFVILKDGKALSADKVKNLSLGDFLTGNYVLRAHSNLNNSEGIFTSLLESIAEKLGCGYTGSGYKGLSVDYESASALNQAYMFTNNQYKTNMKDLGSSDKYMQSFATGTNKIVRNDTYTSISLTNLLNTYLTYFAIAMDGQDSQFKVGEGRGNSKYATDDSNYYWIITDKGTQSSQDILQAEFYNMLYNQICLNGACTDATKRNLVEDKEYLANALKNAQLFISSLNNDGYFYAGHYTLNGHVGEVPDEDAIARAEVEYNITKNKLNYKEETLELQMKNLDMEISSLSTEYDTVKNLISKGVEKVFTMFSS